MSPLATHHSFYRVAAFAAAVVRAATISPPFSSVARRVAFVAPPRVVAAVAAIVAAGVGVYPPRRVALG
ncbi:hypothetical protein [Kushneria aurantia]|uniref:Secreted protein n=1 Tax=Kushneria aurantia TaxID=504092 RepID=A0ABV6G0C1_9GAMM|nr:hypothetical protein [Kushneria aurantia]